VTQAAVGWRTPGAPRPCLFATLATAALLASCQPTVKVEAPDKPIVINLNIKIEQEVRVRIDKELDQAFESNPDLFN